MENPLHSSQQIKELSYQLHIRSKISYNKKRMIPKLLLILAASYYQLNNVYCSLPPCAASSIKKIAITEEKEACNLIENMTMLSAKELNDNLITNCTTVYFCSTESNLLQSLSIQNVHNITFIGINNFSLVNCGGNTGIEFLNVNGLVIKYLKFIYCSQVQTMWVHYKVHKNFTFPSGISVVNCTDLSFVNVTISNSTGMGLSVVNTGGRVTFTDCHFLFNGWGVPRGGAGLFIELSNYYHTAGGSLTHSQYSITNSTFVGNRAHEQNIPSTPFGRGAGICLHIRYGSSHNKVTLSGCNFYRNTADHMGGGFFTGIHDSAMNNHVTLLRCNFTHNQTPLGRGGATHVGFQCPAHTDLCKNNSFHFERCEFVNNTARLYGGGSVFTSTHVANESYNIIHHHKCAWVGNSAHYGAAMALLPDTWTLLDIGELPAPSFTDCRMDSNFIFKSNISDGELRDPYRQNTMGVGALYCMLYHILFYGTFQMRNNSGSAILGSSCKLTFGTNSLTNFQSNSGYNGGALFLIGYSFVKTKDNASLSFINNMAAVDGGAIYYKSTDILEHTYSNTCFISRKNNTNSNARFLFSGNLANGGMGHGDAIYITSLAPCMREYHTYNASGLFKKIANFSFTNTIDKDVATSVSRFVVKANTSQAELPVIPGKYTTLPFEGLNELNNTKLDVYMLIVINDENSTIQSHQYSYITNNTIKLVGNPGDTGLIQLSTLGLHKTVLSFKVVMQPCPPGYILSPDGHAHTNTCMCSADTTPYIGIESCDLVMFQARARNGFWFGYIMKNQSTRDPSFVSGYCPNGFCHLDENGSMLLSPTASNDMLNDLICEPARKGILCSECMENNSVYFHSPSFKCGSRDLCYLGWLFYILTDLVPVTIVFAIILIFNISFTSGATNGFIFYAQVIGFFRITANNRVRTTEETRDFLKIIQSLYKSFNLQFFHHEDLSFCLIQNANNLDLITFQYITIFYAFLLVFSILLILKLCNIRGIKLLFKCRVHSIQASMIHGLSAFLVLCFAQCANISLSLLSYGQIQGERQELVKTVVFLYAECEWFSKKHLTYVLPALTVTLIVVVIPLVTLLAYPHCYKCKNLLKLQESSSLQDVCQALPIYRLKPFLDSFQGCFKDHCRFFSGIYFLYRILILLNTYINYQNYFFITLELQLILMLLLHLVFQPYKRRRYNLIDTLLFLNMLLINGISQYSFGLAHMPHGVNTKTEAAATVQSILKLIPFIVMACVLAFRALKVVALKCRRSAGSVDANDTNNDDLLNYCDLPAMRWSQSSGSENYNTFH